MERTIMVLISSICIFVFGSVACDSGGGGKSPAEDTVVPQDTIPEVSPDTPCIPSCEDKDCGDDGCEGSCGTCGADETCTAQGTCDVECGNGLCKNFETCSSCPEDCGECCGNGSCDGGWGETCDSCPMDCACDPVGACVDGECVACLDNVAVEGGFAWDCLENEDCIYGLCVEHGAGKFCSCFCVEDECPEGWECGAVDFGGDTIYSCVQCETPDCGGHG